MNTYFLFSLTQSNQHSLRVSASSWIIASCPRQVERSNGTDKNAPVLEGEYFTRHELLSAIERSGLGLRHFAAIGLSVLGEEPWNDWTAASALQPRERWLNPLKGDEASPGLMESGRLRFRSGSGNEETEWYAETKDGQVFLRRGTTRRRTAKSQGYTRHFAAGFGF
ncbi:hypothetical protein [Sulfitobacter sp. MOLA879]|uniref:hypothetical protein n=1 Tax=Sulfitobacter sp. MOLA879 TaxID=3368579 RepID=UPI00374648B7